MLHHELRKLLTLRSTWISATVACIASAAVAALLGWAFTSPELGYSGDSLGLLQTVARTTGPSLYFAAVLGVTAVRADIRDGVARLTLVREPRRDRVWAAKAGATALLAGAICLLSSLAEVALVCALFDAVPVAGGLRAVAVHTLVGMSWALVGIALGTIIDSVLPAVLAVLALPLVIEPLVTALVGGPVAWLPFASGHTAYALIGGDVGPGASAGGANPAAFLLFVVGLAVLALRRFRTAEV